MHDPSGELSLKLLSQDINAAAEFENSLGPIVRIYARELHIKDPPYYDHIYASGGKREIKTETLWFDFQHLCQ